MIAETETEKFTTDTNSPLDHAYCCDPDLSLCGVDMNGWKFIASFDPAKLCIVCEHIELCPKCGATLEPAL